jgi:hypothetical protein
MLAFEDYWDRLSKNEMFTLLVENAQDRDLIRGTMAEGMHIIDRHGPNSTTPANITAFALDMLKFVRDEWGMTTTIRMARLSKSATVENVGQQTILGQAALNELISLLERHKAAIDAIDDLQAEESLREWGVMIEDQMDGFLTGFLNPSLSASFLYRMLTIDKMFHYMLGTVGWR